MKKTYITLRISILLLFVLLVSQVKVFAQEEATEETPKERPVRPAFESGLLFDGATTVVQPAKTLEMIIQHRFGVIDFNDKTNTHELMGIWGASNIRLGLNYSILNNFTVGLGATKHNQMEDLQLKYRIIEQTRSNSIPVTVMLYEIIGVDGSKKTKFDGTPDSLTGNYRFGNRMNYFTQLLVSRRFNDHFSLQFAPGFTHYNCVDSVYDHDRFSLSVAGRYKFTPQGSFIFSADFPISKGLRDYKVVRDGTVIYDKANICLGFEVSTSTHAFHIYLESAQGILPQEDIMWNKNDFWKGEFLIGLNVTRLWNF